MSDRPSAANGKRNTSWGTLGTCPACAQCLCFGCHPTGPCVDDTAGVDVLDGSSAPARFTSANFGAGFDGAWLADGASGTTHPAGLRMHCAAGSAEARFR